MQIKTTLSYNSNCYNPIIHYTSSNNDYYSFGMLIDSRSYSSGTGYRYGFNGKEMDNEVKGEGNQQDYGMRIYDTRLGKFLSVDPLTKDYPELTPYQFASNSPIQAIDLDGAEAWVVIRSYYEGQKMPKIEMKFDKDLIPCGGVYTADKYYSLYNGQKTLTSITTSQASYSNYTNQFPNFAQGNREQFSFSNLASSASLQGEANILFAEAGLEIGKGFGGSFGANGKLIGVNANWNTSTGLIPDPGWQSTFRENNQTLEIGGSANYFGVGGSYRHNFDIGTGTFKKVNKIEVNGAFTSASVDGYSNNAIMSWGVNGKAALGFGASFNLNLNIDMNKLKNALQPLNTRFTNYEQKELDCTEKGTKEFDPCNY